MRALEAKTRAARDAMVEREVQRGSQRMPAIDEDDRPKKKIAHEIGQDLTLLSVEELAARVQLLHDEIGRIEADMAQKRASRSAADQFFKK